MSTGAASIVTTSTATTNTPTLTVSSIGTTTTTSNAPIIDSTIATDANLNDRIKQLELELLEKDTELQSIRKDQDDLLELLTEQDLKLNQYKNRLRELGEAIEDCDSDNSIGSDE